MSIVSHAPNFVQIVAYLLEVTLGRSVRLDDSDLVVAGHGVGATRRGSASLGHGIGESHRSQSSNNEELHFDDVEVIEIASALIRGTEVGARDIKVLGYLVYAAKEVAVVQRM